MINSILEFKQALGVTSVAGIRKVIFKSTTCGCTFDEVPDGIEFSGYAEGADADCITHRLMYPFEMAQFYIELAQADEEGCELFDEWNGMDDEDLDAVEQDALSRADDMNREVN